LKQYVSLKKLAPYTDQEYLVHGKKRKKFRSIIQRDIEEVEQQQQQQPPPPPSQMEDVDDHTKQTQNPMVEDTITDIGHDTDEKPNKKKRRRLKKKQSIGQQQEQRDSETLTGPPKAKQQVHVGPNDTDNLHDVPKDNEVMESQVEKTSKRKRRKKKAVDMIENDESMIINTEAPVVEVSEDTNHTNTKANMDVVDQVSKTNLATDIAHYDRKNDLKQHDATTTTLPPKKKKKQKKKTLGTTAVSDSRLAAYGL
jgi:hypothetical protein